MIPTDSLAAADIVTGDKLVDHETSEIYTVQDVFTRGDEVGIKVKGIRMWYAKTDRLNVLA